MTNAGNCSLARISSLQSTSMHSYMFDFNNLIRFSAIVGTIFLLSACGPKSPDTGPGTAPDDWPDGLVPPIQGATFSMAQGHFPGAPRHYREGVHKGFDFFNGLSGRPLSGDEPIVAVAEGEIVRVDHGYEDPGAESLVYWAQLAAEGGMLGQFALDQLHGRQVWIRHADGHISRYSHLSAIDPVLQVGHRVERDQPIALMGNSGIPPTDDQPEPAPHLHFELWSPDGTSFLGEGLTPLDNHRLIAELFGIHALPRYAQGMVRRVNAGQSPPEEYPPAKLPEVGFQAEPPQAVVEGAVFAVPITWDGDDFRPEDFFGFLQGQALGVIDSGDGAWILGAMPVDIVPDSLSITIGAVDPFGQTMVGSQRIERVSSSQRLLPLAVDPQLFEFLEPDNFQIESEQLTPVILDSLSRFDALWQQPFDAPIDGEIGRVFGQRIFHGVLRADHPLPGVSVPADEGSPVLATNTGIVGLVADLPIRGRTVAIIHGGGLVSIYGHLSEVQVNVGDEVAINQPIGAVGATGAVSEPQLRWEMLVAGIATDPVQWLGQILPGRPDS
jgi:murein DD-endopeptidase MepM/ murein hydrolase activator NlpD